ncbi:MAG: glycosyltransferase [Flavobacteriales bacterium]|jgi:predicted glycosyltransferase|nr:glycosyltransferase [Flavobacteriales bacterium]
MERTLIASLNWGLGHATRCVPIIEKELENKNQEVIIASSGVALEFLLNRFPDIPFIDLPDYQIRYHKNFPVWLSIVFQFPRIVKTVYNEHRSLKALNKQLQFSKIISDNRYGIWLQGVPSNMLIHQVNISTKWRLIDRVVNGIHQKYLREYFDELWVPDFKEEQTSLGGYLTHGHFPHLKINYIGPLSHLNQKEVSIPKKEGKRIFVLISGNEPKRTRFEKRVLKVMDNEELLNEIDTIVVAGGKVGKSKKSKKNQVKSSKIQYHAFMNADELAAELTNSDIIICRSGYSSLMDIYPFLKQKKIILIPTPGQTEQEYLAEYWAEKNPNVVWIPEYQVSKKLIVNISDSSELVRL